MSTDLNDLLAQSGHPALASETAGKFAVYLTLLQKWNARTNLTAIRDEEGILSRHFLESILCAYSLPENVSSLLDLGSGAGFPGIPIALIRKEISVTLAESQNKKAAFLREAVRTLNLETKVHAARAETLQVTFDAVTLRAVDNRSQAIPAAIDHLNPSGWLAILTTTEDVEPIQAQAHQFAPFSWRPTVPLPQGTQRLLLLGQQR